MDWATYRTFEYVQYVGRVQPFIIILDLRSMAMRERLQKEPTEPFLIKDVVELNERDADI